MPFQPFQTELAERRAVRLPGDLDDDARQRLIAKLTAAARQQSELAEKSDGVLRITGDPVVADGVLLIPHEPASPLDPARLEDPDPPPDVRSLWWLSLGPLDALKHAAAGGVPHGGIQSGALYRDEAGRIKLGDFGIAPAFETVCGIDQRRQVHCDPLVRHEPQRVSGTWALLEEDTAREYGWIAPYFAHELLEGKLRLNPKSDQFALGTLLFLLTTGTHPYGAALSDPTMMFYFHLEPYEVRDERGDWDEAFERDGQGLASSDDAPILAWSKLLRRMLASDSGQRYPNLGEARDEFAGVLPAGWDDWRSAVRAGQEALDAGDVAGFLEQVEGLETELPAVAEEPFAAWVGAIAARREEIARGQQLRKLLDEAETALDDLNLERCRELAEQIRADEAAEDDVRRAAETLLEQAAEQESFMKSGADALADAYLKSARECLEGDRLDEARQLLDGVLNDPGTPPARAAQARDLLTEVELIEQHTEQQVETLNAAAEDAREGRYEAARQRLDALLAEDSVPVVLAEQARLLLADVQRLQAARAEYVAALDDARSAWERADADGLSAALDRVPEHPEDREVAEMRGDLVERLGGLRAALAERVEIEAAAAAEDHEQVVARLLPLVDDESLPQLLRDECRTLRATAREQLEALHRARIEAARGYLAEAEAAVEAGETARARALLDEHVLPETALSDDDRGKARALVARCDACDEARATIENARGHAEAGAFTQGLTILDTLTVDELPAVVTDAIDAAREEIEQAAAAHAEQERADLRERLAALPGDLEAGRLDEVGQVLVACAGAQFVDADLQGEIDRLQAELDRQRPLQTKLNEIEQTLAGAPDLERVRAALEALPAEVPPWAEPRIEAARARLDEIADDRRRAAQQQAAADLDAVAALLSDCDVAGATAQLEALDPAGLDQPLAQRHAELCSQRDKLAHWLAPLTEAERAFEAGDVPAAHRGAMALGQEDALPGPIRTRAEALLEQTRAKIVTRREEIDGELDRLAQEMQRIGKRFRQFPERVASVRADGMATKAQKERAGELEEAFAALPEPPPSRWPLYVGGGAAGVAVLAGLVWFMMRPAPPAPVPVPTPVPPVTIDNGPRIAEARARLATAFEEIARQADAEGRLGPAWRIVFAPEDAVPTTLYAEAGAERIALGTADDEAALAALALPGDLLTKLWRDPPPPERTLEERIADADARLHAAYERQRTGDDPDVRFAFEGAGPVRVQLVAPERTIDLGPVAIDELDALELDGAWLTELRTPRWMRDAVARVQQQVDAARSAAMGDAPRYEVRFDQPSLPATLVAAPDDGSAAERLVRIERADELPGLAFEEAWRERLFPPPPPPSLAELAEATRAALSAAVPAATFAAGVRGETVTVTGTWNEVTLLPLSLRVNAQQQLDPDEAAAVAHFERQVAALEPLMADGARWIALDADYDGRLRAAWSAAEVEQVATGIALTVPAALDGAPDAAARFEVSGYVENGAVQPDQQSRDRWAGYLADVQAAAWRPLPAQWRTALRLPEAIRLAPADGGELGARVSVELLAGNDTLLSLPADWSAADLTYELDAAAGRTALAEQIGREVEQSRDRLQAAWPELRDLLGQGLAAGSAAWPRAELAGLEIGSPQAAGPFEAAVTARVELDGQPLTVPLVARWTPGGVTWDAVTAGQRTALADALRALGASPAWRSTCEAAALDALRQQDVEIGAARPTEESGTLTLETEDGDTYRWEWDTARLDWREPTRTAAAPTPTPTPAGVDGQLAQLAGQASVSADALAAVLEQVGREKAQRYGGGLTPRSASLRDASGRFINTVAGDPQFDPYPTVFVEYYVGRQSVYAMSWQLTNTNRGRGGSIEQARVWEVMPTAELNGFRSEAALRSAYTQPGVGERLLGPAIGGRIEAGAAGTWGLAVAPDGPLWMVRWEQVNFGNKPVSSIKDDRRSTPGSVSRLHELVAGELSPRREWTYARTGIWCTPSFGLGPPAGRRVTLDLPGAAPGGGAVNVRFRSARTAGDRLVATIKGDGGGNVAGLVQQVNALGQADLGRFWNIGWEGGNWRPNPMVGFVILYAE